MVLLLSLLLGGVSAVDETIASDLAACEEAHKRGAGDGPVVKSMAGSRAAAWKSAAAKGEPAAMWLYGRALAEGCLGRASPSAALDWYERAADAGFGLALNEIGEMNELGVSFRKNMTNAAKWYEKAAAAGCGLGMENLGNCLVNGAGVAKDYAKAKLQYQAAADLGFSGGHRGLGILAERGLGTTADPSRAERHLRAAVELGNTKACADLARVISAQRSDAESMAEVAKLRAAAKEGEQPTPPVIADSNPADSSPKPEPGRGGGTRAKGGVAKAPPTRMPTTRPTARRGGNTPMDGLWAGQRRKPDGKFAPNLPDGYHGPAPSFAGKWKGTVPHSSRNEKTYDTTFTFDAEGRPTWNNRSYDSAPVDLPSTAYSDRNASVARTRKLTFVSVTPNMVCYTVSTTLIASASMVLDFTDAVRHTFRPVPGSPDELELELYSAKGDRLMGRYRLQRAE